MVMASRASEKQPGKYRADVDGMRALAVVLVVLNHVGLGFAGGYVGVDVFFVISGYLITGIVWRELLAGSFSFGGFYERRARRILPAFGVTALVTLAAGWYLLLPFGVSLVILTWLRRKSRFCTPGHWVLKSSFIWFCPV